MADLFTSLVALAPGVSKLSGRQVERAPGITPSSKKGIWSERTLAGGGVATYLAQAALNAYLQGELILSAGLDAEVVTALGNGLISFWALDGNSTDARGPNNGTDTAITYAPGNGIINDGAGFNGTTSFINVGSTAALNLTQMSFSAWVKSASTANYRMIFTRGPSGGCTYEFRFEITSGMLSLISGATQITSIAPTINVMHHLCFTRSAANAVLIYVDGTQQGSGTVASVPNLPSTATFMGKRADGYFLSGAMDAVGVWDRVLTPTEIATLYNAGAGIQYPF